MNTETTADAAFNGHRISTAFLDAGSDGVVVFCHGFKGVKTGPSRLFVKAARMFAEHDISSLRFDQHGSGDSDGEFIDSSFLDWIATTEAVVDHYLAMGHRVALFGQSMGGAAAITVAADNPAIEGVVDWCAGASLEAPNGSPDDIEEEGGQLLRVSYWHEAHDARVAERLRDVNAAVYLVFGTADELVDESSRRAMMEQAQPHHTVDVVEGLSHSTWSVAESNVIVERSVRFLVDTFASEHDRAG